MPLCRTFIPVGDRAISAILATPATLEVKGAVVVVPSYGLEGEDSFRTTFSLALKAARAGFFALLIDLSGSGDSAALQKEDDVPAAWRDDVRGAIAYARGCCPLVPLNVVGYRLGGAIIAGLQPEEADLRILWEPISGKQFLRRIRLLSSIVESDTRGADKGLIGLDLTPSQAESLRDLRRPQNTSPAADERMMTRVETDRTKARSICEVGPYLARVPLDALEAMISDLRQQESSRVIPPPDVTEHAELPASGGSVREEFVSVGPHRLAGVLTRPFAGPEAERCVLFTAQGSERSAGPGSVWASTARELAVGGVASIRCDRRMLGLHTDPAAPREPNPYTEEAIDDVRALVRYGRATFQHVTLVGSCAGAWLAIRAVETDPVDDLIAVNVPAWTRSVSTFDTRYLNRWHGINDVELSERGGPAESVTLRQRLRSLLRGTAWTRPAALLMRVVQSRSLGVPLVRELPRNTRIQLILSPPDAQAFRAAGGELVGSARRRSGQLSLTMPRIDHALHTPSARRHIRDAVLARSGAYGRRPVSV